MSRPTRKKTLGLLSMNHADLAELVKSTIKRVPDAVPKNRNEENRRNNAAICMAALICNRLSQSGEVPVNIKHSNYKWGEGLFTLRNARVTGYHWSNLRLNPAEQFHQEAQETPAVYILTSWMPEEKLVHVWVIPEDVAYQAFSEIPVQGEGTFKTLQLFPETHELKNAPNGPDLSTCYVLIDLSGDEIEELFAALKVDRIAKDSGGDATRDESEEELMEGVIPLFNASTVNFLKELPRHATDPAWHTENKSWYHQSLKDPVKQFVKLLRDRYITQLNPEVAGSSHNVSRLKKNDYGGDGYHDHYWFAFFDPEARSKTKSVQLFFGFHGSDLVCRYGFAMGDYCKSYFQRLKNVIQEKPNEIASYVQNTPDDTIFELLYENSRKQVSPDAFRELAENPDGVPDLKGIQIIREFSLDKLPEHEASLVDEVGRFFTWTWPFFEASITGVWPGDLGGDTTAGRGAEDEDVDEDAPASLEELSDSTSLAESFLGDLEQALLAKQQTILVGPPGTSKTYIARQFARYFVRDTAGRPQGTHHTLYMHSNWSYEDFFEGIRPTTSEDGTLGFKPQKGFFLEWVEQLKNFDPRARHVLVLDEINRCDTASVLGELLQLLEYRGTTIRLLSGRHFVFPKNLYIIGTMNSADRSIGRMDLALRRRFLWMNLHCQPETLRRWLKRAGNNPVGFDHSQLAQCNELLSNRGISPEQHIGHALFMAQESGVDDESETPGDIPLTENHLRRIVKFSVVPYVEELLVTQFGQVDSDLIRVINDKLLSCLSESDHQN